MGYGQLKKRTEEVKQDDISDLMCCAHGCPMRWSVSNGQQMCSYHAWAPMNEWPSITQDLRMHGPWSLVTPREPVEYDKNLDPKAWAKRLQNLDDAGVKLTHAVREMYKRALRLQG